MPDLPGESGGLGRARGGTVSRSRPPAYVDHRFTVHDVLDPRWLQLGFAVAFAFAMGLLALGGSTIELASLLGAASLLCLAVTVVVMVLPWPRRAARGGRPGAGARHRGHRAERARPGGLGGGAVAGAARALDGRHLPPRRSHRRRTVRAAALRAAEHALPRHRRRHPGLVGAGAAGGHRARAGVRRGHRPAERRPRRAGPAARSPACGRAHDRGAAPVRRRDPRHGRRGPGAARRDRRHPHDERPARGLHAAGLPAGAQRR